MRSIVNTAERNSTVHHTIWRPLASGALALMLAASHAPTARLSAAPLDPTTVASSGATSVTYYDGQGGLRSTTTIPAGSIMRRGGEADPCTFVAAVAGTTFDGTAYSAGDTVTSTRWVFSEQILIGTSEAPGPTAIVTDLSGPIPRRLLSISCDSTDHFQDTVWVTLNDPFWDPRPAGQQLRNELQLIDPAMYRNAVVERWGGLVTRYPTWLAVEPAAWQPQRSPQATYRGWTIHLYAHPRTLDFDVEFTPDPDRPSPPFSGNVACVDATHPGSAGANAFPAVPTLPDIAPPGVNARCTWTPPGPGTVTLQARVTYQVVLWVNGYQEPQPDYTLRGPAATFRVGELAAVNTNH